MDPSIRFSDVLYFLAELAVYVVMAWWGLTRDVPVVFGALLGVGGVAVLAAAWAIFAAPRARIPLHGIANVVFRVAWFGIGAAAGLALVAGA
jgi:hypothetical protein